jgi:hypothetical protein
MPWPLYTLDVGAFAGSRVFGGNAPLVAAAGISLTAGRRFDEWLPELWLSGMYNTPFDASDMSVEIHSQVLSLRGGLALRLLEHEDWYLEAGAGAGADVFFIDARSFLNHRGDTTAASPVATALLSAHYSLGSRIAVFASFTLDVDLQPRRFVDGPSTVYEAARVRPTLVIGFDLAAIGAKAGEP